MPKLTYRIYRWGQRMDVYDGGGRFYSLSHWEMQWQGVNGWMLRRMRRRAALGEEYAKNWLVCRDELIDLGYISGD